MNLHKPKALHRFSERGLEGREWAGEKSDAKPATACKQLHEMPVAVSPVGDVDA